MFSGHYEFGEYSLEAQSRMLFRGDDHVPLPPKGAELLLALVQAAGRYSPEKNYCSDCGRARSSRREPHLPHFLAAQGSWRGSEGAGLHRDLTETRLPVRRVGEAVCPRGTRSRSRSGDAAGAAVREPQRCSSRRLRKASPRLAASFAYLMSWKVPCAGKGSGCASQCSSCGSAMKPICGLKATSAAGMMCSMCRRRSLGPSRWKSSSS